VTKVPNYLKAVKLVLHEVGCLTPREQRAYARGLDMLDFSAEIRRELDAFDPQASSLEELIPDLKPGGVGARMILRDVVEIHGGDGTYGDDEKAQVAKVAAKLGVDAPTLRALEALVDMEHAVHRLRSSLLPIQD